jgi:hypothetical protein
MTEETKTPSIYEKVVKIQNEISVKKEESIFENKLVETKKQDSVEEDEKNIDMSNNVNENKNNRKNMFLKKEN